MSIDFAHSIRNKLTDGELAWLARQSRPDLRHPESVAERRTRIQAVRSMRRGATALGGNVSDPRCDFCDQRKSQVGPLVQGTTRAHICGACAQSAVVVLNGTRRGECFTTGGSDPPP